MLHKYIVILVRCSNIQHCSTEYMQFIQVLCNQICVTLCPFITIICVEYWLAYIQSRLFYNFKIKANEAGPFSTRNCPLWFAGSCEIRIIDWGWGRDKISRWVRRRKPVVLRNKFFLVNWRTVSYPTLFRTKLNLWSRVQISCCS